FILFFLACTAWFNQKVFSQCEGCSEASETALPVILTSFQGTLHNDQVNLNWALAANETCYKFEIERSFDGSNFTTAALVFTSEKRSSENYMYHETSETTSRILYRLRMYDKNGAATYSKILVFQTRGGKTNEIRIVNNPITDPFQGLP